MLTQRARRSGIAMSVVALAAILLFVVTASIALLAFAPPMSGNVLTSYTWRILQFTLLQAALSTLLSAGLAIPVALALARRPQFFGRLWVLRLMALPMGLPVLVVSFGMIAVWGRQGIANSLLLSLGMNEPVSIYGLGGILLAHVFFNLPLACRLFVAELDRMPGEYWKLAAGFGMTSFSIFRFIEWPALRRVLPGIVGLIFMLCATSFTIVLVLGGGPAATTLEVAIYQSLKFDFDPPRAITLSLMQISLTALILVMLSLLGKPDDHTSTHGAPNRRFDGASVVARAWDAFVVLAAVTFLVLPLVAILLSGLRADLLRLLASQAFLDAAATSAAVAILSALLTLALSMMIIAGRQAIADLPGRKAAARIHDLLLAGISSLVLLVPPIVLGTGWFLLLRPGGESGMMVLALVAAINALMALPFAMRILEPAMNTHRARTARLAASLGIGSIWKIWHIDRPALARTVALALSFTAALSLGDLGAVALFGSGDFITLPWLLYSRLSSYRTADADGLALILGAACLALTVLGTFGQRDDRSGRAAD